MKKTTKLLAFVMIMMLAVSGLVFANEAVPVTEVELTENSMEIIKTTIPVETVNLGDFIGDQENWSAGGGDKLAFKDDKIITESGDLICFAYQQDPFLNKLVQYKMSFNFKRADGSDGWGGFALRSRKSGIYSWSGGGGYLVVIKHDRIELQCWGGSRQRVLEVVPNNVIKNNVPVNISAGAVNIENGVNIFMFVDGVCVLNVFDDNKDAITEGDYFNIYATNDSELSAYDGETIKNIPAAVKIKGKAVEGATCRASYTTVTFGNESSVDDFKASWYFSPTLEGTDQSEIEKSAKAEFGSKYPLYAKYTDLQNEGLEHVVKADEVDGYYRVFIEDAEGNTLVKGNPFVVNIADYIRSESVTLLVDCEFAYINGAKVQIDPDDYSVMPCVVDDRTLVPVRFVAESFGAEVLWDYATRTVTIKLGDKTIVMTLDSKDYTVNGEAMQLDVPAQVMSDRTMVPVRVVSEAFGKTVFWDASNMLIVISDKDLGLDSEKDSSSFSYIFEKIQEIL